MIYKVIYIISILFISIGHSKSIWDNNLIYEELKDPNYIEILLNKIYIQKNKYLDLKYFKNFNKKKDINNFDSTNYEKALNIYKNFKNV